VGCRTACVRACTHQFPRISSHWGGNISGEKSVALNSVPLVEQRAPPPDASAHLIPVEWNDSRGQRKRDVGRAGVKKQWGEKVLVGMGVKTISSDKVLIGGGGLCLPPPIEPWGRHPGHHDRHRTDRGAGTMRTRKGGQWPSGRCATVQRRVAERGDGEKGQNGALGQQQSRASQWETFRYERQCQPLKPPDFGVPVARPLEGTGGIQIPKRNMPEPKRTIQLYVCTFDRPKENQSL